MKMLMKSGLILAVMTLAFTINSCKSTSKGYHSSPVMSKNVELDPIKADINVDESKKLKGTF